jgi:hypothetical protein
MKTHRWMTHLDMRARAVPGKHSRAAQHADRLSLAAHRLFAMALLLGLGIVALATSRYAIGHVSAQDFTSAGQVINIPWMY